MYKEYKYKMFDSESKDYESNKNPQHNTLANEWIKFGMRLGVSSALHPFEYAKVLMQVIKFKNKNPPLEYTDDDTLNMF